MEYSLLILGRQPDLGMAELESLYGADRLRLVGENVAELKMLPCSIDFSRLGGSMKLCKTLSVLPTNNWPKIVKFISDAAPKHAINMPDGKMHLGLSVYGLDISPAKIMAGGLTIKKSIQKSGRSVRLVPNKEPELNTAQVLHNKLLSSNGWELVIACDGDKTIIGQSLLVQDINGYTKRDRERPKRDTRVGMLPPKLAQIIINLSVGPQEFKKIASELTDDICIKPDDKKQTRSPRHEKAILDPFCGTGVVLQEALLMGYKILGSDLEPRMIDYSKQNLDWLAKTYGLDPQLPNLTSGDATVYNWPSKPDCVASEVYLGRPFTSKPNSEILAQTVSECNLIIKKFLQNIHDQLAAGTRLCLAVPAWRVTNSELSGNDISGNRKSKIENTFLHLPLIDSLESLGYNRVSFERVSDNRLIYYRDDQFVARELLVLEKLDRI